MLNAFRHQRFDTIKEGYLRMRDQLCSTPFGIRDSTRLQKIRCSPPPVVLNAFRHQRFDTSQAQHLVLLPVRAQRLSASEIRHLLEVLNYEQTQKCSTPFGIRDSTQFSLNWCNKRAIRAQRLSASEIRHGQFFETLSESHMCSTPFGIRDSTRC